MIISDVGEELDFTQCFSEQNWHNKASSCIFSDKLIKTTVEQKSTEDQTYETSATISCERELKVRLRNISSRPRPMRQNQREGKINASNNDKSTENHPLTMPI
jgi:hypothetical protein